MGPFMRAVCHFFRLIGLYFVEAFGHGCKQKCKKSRKKRSSRDRSESNGKSDSSDKGEGSDTHWKYGKKGKRKRSRRSDKEGSAGSGDGRSTGSGYPAEGCGEGGASRRRGRRSDKEMRSDAAGNEQSAAPVEGRGEVSASGSKGRPKEDPDGRGGGGTSALGTTHAEGTTVGPDPPSGSNDAPTGSAILATHHATSYDGQSETLSPSDSDQFSNSTTRGSFGYRVVSSTSGNTFAVPSYIG